MRTLAIYRTFEDIVVWIPTHWAVQEDQASQRSLASNTHEISDRVSITKMRQMQQKWQGRSILNPTWLIISEQDCEERFQRLTILYGIDNLSWS